MNNIRTKRVLMLCQTFPPESDVGGLRGAMFCKYLCRYGWKPIVFSRVRPSDDQEYRPTMDIPGLPVLSERITFEFGKRDEEYFLKKRGFYQLIKHFFCPDFSHPPGFVDKWLDVASEKIKEQSFSVVWGSSPYLGDLTVARAIAEQFNIPWVADFRDITEQYQLTKLRDRVLKLRVFFRTYHLIKTAAAVITVSEHHARKLEKVFKKKVFIINNGYDPEMFKFQSHNRCEKFTITYMGRLLSEWLQNPRPFFQGIDLLLQEGIIREEDICIKFYGTESSILSALLSTHSCKRIVQILPLIPYSDVPRKLQNSCVLLLLTNMGRDGILTTKLYEYLAAKRPILCVPGDGAELDKLIMDNNSGISCSSPESVAKIIKSWFVEWKKYGIVKWKGNEESIARYSREKQAGQLATILDMIYESNTYFCRANNHHSK